MSIRYPQTLRAGDVIGVTSPSSGVGAKEQGRLDYALGVLRERGFTVEVGDCMDGSTHVSASARQRAAELMRMLLDPRIRAIVPPWGGETAIDLLPYLDFDAVAQAEPTWFVGYSDISTLLTPLTLLTGVATVHGSNLMDTPYDLPSPLLPWTAVVALTAGSTFRQSSPGVHRLRDWDDWERHPGVSSHAWNGEGEWTRLDVGTAPVDVRGRLIGGCIETLANVAGSVYGDTSRLRRESETGVIVYVEASGDDALTICRNLHGMRLAGFFDGARAIFVGRTAAPDSPTLSQAEAVIDALAVLDIPIIADVDCGHVPPQLSIVNGALGRLVFTESEQYLEQTLV